MLPKANAQQKITLLHLLIFENWLNQPDSAEIYAEQALIISRRLNDQKNISKSLRLLGGTFNYKGEFEKALKYNVEALEIANQINDSILMHNALNNIGFVNISLGNFQNALEYLMRSYEMKKKLKVTYGLEHTLNNIGLVYQQALMFDSAHHYLQKGLMVAKKNQDYELMIYSQNNIGNTHLKQFEFDEAEKYFRSSLRYTQKHENRNWQAVTLYGMGQVMLFKAQYDSARYYLNQSFSIRESIKDQKGMGEIYLWLAKLNFMQGEEEQSLSFLRKGDSIANKIKAKDLLIKINEVEAMIQQKLGNFEKANEILSTNLKLKDSLYVNALGRNLSLINLKLRENQNRILLQESQIALKEKSFQNLVYISILILIIPFSFLLVLIFQRNRKINNTLKKQNDKVEAQKEEIETQKEYLEQNLKKLEDAKNVISQQKEELEILNQQLAGTVDKRNIELKSVNERLRTTSLELDNFIYKSSHDIKGPIVRLMGICDLALQDVEDAKALNYFSMLDKAALRLNIIIESLKLISELQEKQLKNRLIDFRTILQDSFNEAAYIENIKVFKLNIDIEKNFLFYSDESLVKLIAFNLIQNSLQLMKSENLKNYHITFSVSQKSDDISMLFKLDGLKLIDDETNKLMNGFSKAQNEYENISIGLYTVKQCIQKLNGNLTIKSSKGKDTIFEVSLPKTVQ
ncbi:tetratricopeptide repeat-containing sensor histidine kinase [Marivirga arenosa]|uniref:histidine kinase n=1 Tax=Marivirga arenosa TaxID=3059076 RepID=A0AA52EXQ1_9BACT|nr:tetratricopeptide repeat-containing sensor histidine kinase [Marivirga sp. BKB1-2]WNB17676.1 tetratricopeptide repeat-containing sensor histidine kinase [Marivirga sp. BKB1-2]